MTKQEIEQAGEEYRDINFNNEIEYESLKKAFIAGAEMVNAKQPYTSEDMIAFLDSIRDYERESHNMICFDERDSKELLKLWEETK